VGVWECLSPLVAQPLAVNDADSQFSRARVCIHRPNGAILFAGVATMSQYVYHCEDCDKEFTHQHHISDADKAEVKCPHCHGTRVHQLVSAFSAVTSKKS
jgi:putative FmdB family regulatory protein